jgi:hypothetical protein
MFGVCLGKIIEWYMDKNWTLSLDNAVINFNGFFSVWKKTTFELTTLYVAYDLIYLRYIRRRKPDIQILLFQNTIKYYL